MGFKLLHKCRDGETAGRRGGGVGVLVDERFDSILIPSFIYSGFEHIIASVNFGKLSFNLVSVYRPPNVSLSLFFDQFQEFLSHLITLQSTFVIAGDFNLHMDDLSSDNVKYLNTILDNFNLKQHVTSATHVKGHTLDLFITPLDFKFSPTINITELLSDHFSITASLDLDLP